MPFRATFDCLWCGAAHACRGPDDLEGWAQLCPDCVGKAGDNGFLRFRLRQALTERGAAGSGAAAWPRREAGPRPRPASPTGRLTAPTRRRRRHARLLRGPGARIRRLVPAPRPLRARADPRRGLERGARRGGTLARRAPDPRRDRRARGRDRLVVAAPRLEGRAVALRRDRRAARARTRAPGRASAAGAPPRARRVGRTRSAGRCRVHRLLAEPRPARQARPSSSRSSGAGSSPAGRSRSSIRWRTPSRARPTTRRRPTTSRSVASTTAANSRSSRSTTSRPSSRRR